jgi:hypothetical protein
MMAGIIGALGGAEGIVSGIMGGIRTIFDFLKDIAVKIAEYIKDIAKWYMELLVEKPEYGITLGVLTIYLLT